MRATAILAWTQDGWLYIDSETAPGIEIAQSHSGEAAEVTRKVEAELDTYGNGQIELTVGIRPLVTDPVPGIDWIEGDELNIDDTWREVEALTSTWSDTSDQWDDVPVFGDILDAPEDRIARSFRGIGGLNGGTSHLARPTGSIPPPNVRP